MRYCLLCKKPMNTSNCSIWVAGENYDIHVPCKKIAEEKCSNCGERRIDHIDYFNTGKKNVYSNSEEEIGNYKWMLNLITDKLLRSLDDIEEEYEQFFQECSVLGIDRLSILNLIKNLLKNNRNDELKKINEYQNSDNALQENVSSEMKE